MARFARNKVVRSVDTKERERDRERKREGKAPQKTSYLFPLISSLSLSLFKTLNIHIGKKRSKFLERIFKTKPCHHGCTTTSVVCKEERRNKEKWTRQPPAETTRRRSRKNEEEKKPRGRKRGKNTKRLGSRTACEKKICGFCARRRRVKFSKLARCFRLNSSLETAIGRRRRRPLTDRNR